MKRLLSFIMVICLMFSLCGCVFLKDVADSTKKEEPKTFEFDGVSIELTTDFLRMDFISEDYDFIVGTDDLTIMGIKAPFNENQELTVEDYANAFQYNLIDSNPTPVSTIDSIPTLQYVTNDNDGEEQKVAVMFYKGTDCFWVICFAAYTDEFSEQYSDICKYAKTVECK